jgi:hypothetical protein
LNFALLSSDNYFFPVQHQHCSIAFNRIPPSFFTKTMSSPTTNKAAVLKAICDIIALITINKVTCQPTNSTSNLLKDKLQKSWLR